MRRLELLSVVIDSDPVVHVPLALNWLHRRPLLEPNRVVGEQLTEIYSIPASCSFFTSSSEGEYSLKSMVSAFFRFVKLTSRFQKS